MVRPPELLRWPKKLAVLVKFLNPERGIIGIRIGIGGMALVIAGPPNLQS